MRIFVTGGCGYIGSHTIVELLNKGHEVVTADNLCNSDKEAIRRVEQITGKNVELHEIDIRDEEKVNEIFDAKKFDAIIHFAGLKAVGESVERPLEYYDNNLNSTIVLLKAMKKHDVRNIIFSSSATVYGNPKVIPITEETPKGKCTNPYGWSKSMLEQILIDVQKSDPKMNVILLRYFNPVGAHESGLIGENPRGIPNNLFPYITQTALGIRKELGIFGSDYPTKDGSGVRDYIHVVDLAKGHVAALDILKDDPGVKIYNLGTGKGYSVVECVETFEKVNKVKVPYSFKARRKGDVAVCYANPTLAWKELGWKAEKTLEDMCADAYKWQKMNPNGYEKKE